MLIEPEKFTLKDSKVLVRKYVKPERVRGIIVPEAWRTDNSRSLWELVQDAEVRGMSLSQGDILISAPHRGVYVGDLESDPGVEVFVLDSLSVLTVLPWVSQAKQVLEDGRILVKIEKTATSSSALITSLEDSKTQGTIVSTGKLRETGLVPGLKVCFTEHAGIRVEHDGEQFLVVHELDILGILNGEVE